MRSSRLAVVMLVSGMSLALGLIALAWAVGLGSSQAQDDTMRNCPYPANWAISVWSGDNGTDAEQAFATCGAQAVQAAYYIDPERGWLRWFAGRQGTSNLTAVDNMQAVLALGAVGAPPPTGTPSGRIAFESDRDGDGEVYVMNADGTRLTNLTNNPASDGEPAWSPDGSKIAFGSERDGNDEVYVMNADGTGQTRLTNNPESGFSPAWSPDGSKIAFDSDRDGDYDIYVMNADGTGVTNLTMNSENDWGAAWSPDGSKIAFGSDREGAAEVYVMNADGTGQTRLTNNPAWDRGADWSADGSKIVFHSDRDGNMEVYVMNADGTSQTRLTNNPAYDGWPSWSPKGSHIAFQSNRDGNLEVYVMKADGTSQTNLTNNPAKDFLPAWSAFGGQQGTMHNCPQPGQWAISVWSGDDGTDAEQAFATCGSQAVQAAYYINPETQSWLRWFAGRPEISKLTSLTTLSNNQGVIALGALGPPAPPTPTPTPAATPTPTLTPTPTPTASPTPTGPIVFSGSIVDGPTKEEPLWGPCGWWWWVVEVQLDKVIKMEEEQGCSGECLYGYVSGETIEVLYFAAGAPKVALGDDVEVSGQESMFACGCACCCDGFGFVVDPEMAGNYVRLA